MPSLTPRPETWNPTKLSQKYVADYKPFSMVDGAGVRCAVYLSGCPFRCEGCFNKVAQSFRYGQAYSPELRDQILADVSQPYVRGLSLLGGEPMLNTQVALDLAYATKEIPGKDIWCWTGYTFEQLLEIGTPDQLELLSLADVLVDGPFEIAEKDLTLRFRGSTNQRLIEVRESLLKGTAFPFD